jgi:predicted dehydrogenase
MHVVREARQPDEAMGSHSPGRPLRVAIVGCGGVARTQHLPVYQKLAAQGRVELVAGCDVDPERAAAVAGGFGGRAYGDVEALLEHERPDVVDVCTPEDRHTQPVLAALRGGAHVFCEKIMAESLAAGRSMLEAAQANRRLLGVDYNYRFMPALAKARELIEAGDLGELALVGAYVHAYCFHHAIDLLRFLGGEVVAVGAQYAATADPAYHYRVQLEEFVYVPSRFEAVTFRFANGACGVIYGTRFMDLRQHMLRVEVAGSAARLGIDGIVLDDVVGRLRRFRFAGGPEGPPDPARSAQGEAVPLPVPAGAQRDFRLAFDGSISAFVAAVAAGTRPPVTGEDGYRVLELEHAIVRSAREDRFVSV